MTHPFLCGRVTPFVAQVRNAMDRARMNSAIRVFNSAILSEESGGMVSEKVMARISFLSHRIARRIEHSLWIAILPSHTFLVCPIPSYSSATGTMNSGKVTLIGSRPHCSLTQCCLVRRALSA